MPTSLARFTFVTASACAVLLALSSPVRADVTVVMRGGVAATPGAPLTAVERTVLGIFTHCTMYFGSNFDRVDGETLSFITDLRSGVTTAVNKADRTYMTFKDTPQFSAASMDRMLSSAGQNASVIRKFKKSGPVVYCHHRCWRYVIDQTASSSVSGVVLSLHVDQLVAFDFKDVRLPSVVIGKTLIKGIVLRANITVTAKNQTLIVDAKAVSISNLKVPPEMFDVGSDYVASADSLSNLKIGGLMSAKAVDPYANLNQFTGAAKAQALVKAGKFDQAGDLARSLAKRNLNAQLGPVYNTLGDHAVSEQKMDAAWGWYCLTVANSVDPNELTHAHFALEQYYDANGDPAKASKELQAIVDLPNAADEDKTKAAGLLDQLKANRQQTNQP